MAVADRPWTKPELFNLLTGNNPRYKLAVLQKIFLELPPEFDSEIFELIKDLRDDRDIGVRFWAKRFYSKFSISFGKAEQIPSSSSLEENLSLEMLIKKLKDVGKSRFLAINVLKRICEMRDPASLPSLVDYLKSSKDAYQISFLTKSLGTAFPSDALLKILTPYLTHKDDRVIANTIEGIEAIGSPTSFAICSRFLGHRSNRVRANAAKALAKYDPQKAFEVLQRMLNNKGQPHLLISACFAIRELKEQRFMGTLKDLLSDDIIFDEVLKTILMVDKKNGIPLLASYAHQLDIKRKRIWEEISGELSFFGKISVFFKFPKHDPFEPLKDSDFSDWKQFFKGSGFRTFSLIIGSIVLIYLLFSGGRIITAKFASPAVLDAKAELEKMKIGFTTEEFLQNMQADNMKVVDLFIKAGIDVNLRNPHGATPLLFSSYCGQEVLVEKLLKAGADVKAQDSEGSSALHLASTSKIAELLMSYGADPNLKDKKGRTPLHKAVENSAIDICKLLLFGQSDPNIQDSNGNTPLHLAASSGKEKIIILLLASGAKKDLKNSSGMAPGELGDSKLLK
ncbi:MAG: ankyrin repeat domain-containing protein [Candidatus Riflebacteria bacterium]|nr:ankyrin repeat domain-containing protein [Candidatus Riflebacteria bacterium]